MVSQRDGQGPEKVSFHPISKKCNIKECSNYHSVALIFTLAKVILKILQARLQQYFIIQEVPDVHYGFRKAEEPEIKWLTSVGS